MQKEIFEQPESVVNTMRGRVNLESGSGNYRIFFINYLINNIVVSYFH